jgi:hypothetical protein
MRIGSEFQYQLWYQTSEGAWVLEGFYDSWELAKQATIDYKTSPTKIVKVEVITISENE